MRVEKRVVPKIMSVTSKNELIMRAGMISGESLAEGARIWYLTRPASYPSLDAALAVSSK